MYMSHCDGMPAFGPALWHTPATASPLASDMMLSLYAPIDTSLGVHPTTAA